jgi:hypothetical protein
MADSTEPRPTGEAALVRRRLRAALHTPAGLRLGILLAEILAPPLARRKALARRARRAGR